MNLLADLKTLVKLHLSLWCGLAGMAGFITGGGNLLSPEALLIFSGVFLSSAGSMSLNQYQERNLDALMERTRKRPLPSGRMSPGTALAIGLTLLLCGGVILSKFGPVPLFLLTLTVLLYNGLYTPLKRLTFLALIPGIASGALPSLIGWSAAGGEMLSRIVPLSLYLVLWQVPHFLVLSTRFRKDFSRARIRTGRVRLPEGREKTALVLLGVPLILTASAPWLTGYLKNPLSPLIILSGSLLLLLSLALSNDLRRNFQALNLHSIFFFVALFLG
ncbi:MAG: protoheme IX farnesyltransferase [Deltaproteobacteria bacterium]|nr:MAG: protoheme IX farnesyltransferase [Deltaproteobacteria bacterium]